MEIIYHFKWPIEAKLQKHTRAKIRALHGGSRRRRRKRGLLAREDSTAPQLHPFHSLPFSAFNLRRTNKSNRNAKREIHKQSAAKGNRNLFIYIYILSFVTWLPPFFFWLPLLYSQPHSVFKTSRFTAVGFTLKVYKSSSLNFANIYRHANNS